MSLKLRGTRHVFLDRNLEMDNIADILPSFCVFPFSLAHTIYIQSESWCRYKTPKLPTVGAADGD